MKVLSKKDEQLVDVNLAGGKDAPLTAHVEIGDMSFDSPGVETKMTRVGKNLEATIRISGVANFKVLLEPKDVKALKGMANKDVIGFLLRSAF